MAFTLTHFSWPGCLAFSHGWTAISWYAISPKGLQVHVHIHPAGSDIQLLACAPPPPLLPWALHPIMYLPLWPLQVDLQHVEHFISVIGAFEDQIFQKRARLLQRQKQRRERDKANKGQQRQAGQGQAGSKWKAAVPNASFTASLQPVGQHQSGLHHPFAVHPLADYQKVSKNPLPGY